MWMGLVWLPVWCIQVVNLSRPIQRASVILCGMGAREGVAMKAWWDRHWHGLQKNTTTKGRFTLRWRRPPVGQECLVKTWLYEANGGCAGEELKAIKYFFLSWASPVIHVILSSMTKVHHHCFLPSVNTHQSRVSFSTNHNWETPFFSWPVDFSTVV